MRILSAACAKRHPSKTVLLGALRPQNRRVVRGAVRSPVGQTCGSTRAYEQLRGKAANRVRPAFIARARKLSGQRSRCSRATPPDPATVGVQIEKLRQRFGLERVVLVGDRGMLTRGEPVARRGSASQGWNWVSASSLRRHPQELVESGAVQLSVFRCTRRPGRRSAAMPTPAMSCAAWS